MLHLAEEVGVKFVDTARAYHESERIVGLSLTSSQAPSLRVITKLSPIDTNKGLGAQKVLGEVDASVNKSCIELGINSLDVLLLHRIQNLHSHDGIIWDRLIQLREEGLIKTLGVSIESPDELEIALEQIDINLIQLPFNILDHRWDKFIKQIEQQKRHKDLTIHARSLFLQGLFLSEEARAWKIAHVENPKKVINWLKRSSERLGFDGIPELCIKFALSQKWIDGLVIGMENINQLATNINYFNSSNPGHIDFNLLNEERPRLSKATLNPRYWKKK